MKCRSAVEGTRSQKNDGDLTEEENSKKDQEDAVQEQKRRSLEHKKEQKPEDTVLLVVDSLVRHVRRILQKQCVGFSTFCKPGGRKEQMLPEIEKRDVKDDTVIV